MAKQFDKRRGTRGIEWCDRTINPIGGCMHDCKWEMPDGTVAGCYAKSVAENVARDAFPQGFEHHYWRPKMLEQVGPRNLPELVFVDSMSDMFAPEVPADQIELIFERMRQAPQTTFQSLTKAAPQILKYTAQLPFNLWVGVSSPPDWMHGERLNHASQLKMLKRSLDVLRQVKEQTGNIVWMSAEPVSWDLTEAITEDHPLSWIVIGAASNGPKYFQPDPRNIERLLRVMDATRTPVFFKGNIAAMFDGNVLGDPGVEPCEQITKLNRWREDFPMTYSNGQFIPAVQQRQKDCERYGWALIGHDKPKKPTLF